MTVQLSEGGFSEGQKTVIFTVIIIGSMFSVLGSGAIILHTIIFKNFLGKNKIWNRIIFCLSLCDLCGSLDLMLGHYMLDEDHFGNHGACKFQGLRIQFFFIGSVLWTAAIAINIFLVVVMKKEIYQIERFEYIYHIVIWGICILSSVLLYITDINKKEGNYIIGEATFWCWITNNGCYLRLYFFFGPLWIIFFFNFLAYITMIITCKKKNIDKSQIYAENNNDIASRCHLYLLVLFATWIWGTVNRIQNTIDKDHPIYSLNLLQAIFTPLQGFLNSVVYFWYSVIKHFIDLRRNIQKEENHMRELRNSHNHHHHHHHNEEGLTSRSSNRQNYSDNDIYDNFYVYKPKPSPLYINKGKCKDKGKEKNHCCCNNKEIKQNSKERGHSSNELQSSDEHHCHCLSDKKNHSKDKHQYSDEINNLPSTSSFNLDRHHDKIQEDESMIDISVSQMNSTTPILNKMKNNTKYI